MQRFFTVLILTFLMLTFYVSDVTHANTDESGNVDVAEKNIRTYKDRANTAYDNVQYANSLYIAAKAEYDKNAAKIERGVAVTASKLLAATASVYLSGGVTVTFAVSALVDMFELAESINKSTSLLSAYEATISNKQVTISSFESAKTTYNTGYDTLVGVLATHAGWTKADLVMYIADDANRDGGVIHKGISGSGKHGIEGKKIWGAYDNSLPSYTCKGPCSDTFITPTLAKTSHRTTCTEKHGESGTTKTRWSCPNSICTHSDEHWRLCPGSCDKKFPPKRISLGQGNYHYESNFPHKVICKERVWDGFFKFWANCHGKYGDSSIWYTCELNSCPNSTYHNDGSTPSTPTPTPTPTPSYHACGVHETTVSGSHASASCGESGHYACDSKTHTAAVCGTTGHYNCDNKNHSMQVSCTIHSTCEVINFYACDNHDPAVTCANGHSYNPTIAGENNMHRTRTCEWCAQTWEKCVSLAPICNKPYRKRNGLSCRAID